MFANGRKDASLWFSQIGCSIVFHRIAVRLVAAAAFAVAASTSTFAQDPADASKLPRPADAKVVYAGPQTTIVTTGMTPDAAFADLEKQLAAAGWQNYREMQERQDPGARTLVSRKGAIGLEARIAPAPAQGNATTIQYITNPLRNDVPFPPEARDIKFDPNTPVLEANTAKAFDAVAAFYVAEMKPRGYDLHQPLDGSEAIAGDAKNQRAFFTKTGQRPLLLLMRALDAGGTAVKLEAVSPQLLPKPKPPAQAQAQTPVPAPAAPPNPGSDAGTAISKQIDSMIGDVLKDVQKQMGGAARPQQPPAPPRATEPALKLKADANAPIPVPETAGAVDADGNSLDFSSPSSVRALADFYRSEMRKAGWSAGASPINRDNMVVLNFGRGGKSLTMTIMRAGDETRVSAQSDIFATGSKANPGAAASASDDGGPDVALEVEDSGGLPVPKPNSSVGKTRSLFRIEASATVKARVDTVLAFYKRELSARGWSEIGAAKVSSDTTTADFKAPEGPARLTIERKGGETYVTLAVRQEAEARKSGLMPKSGTVRLLFGSMADGPAVVTVAGRTVNVAPGVGQKGTDGPTLEVKPGTLKVTVKVGKQPPQTETVPVAEGEIWGLLIGPGGILPLQAY